MLNRNRVVKDLFISKNTMNKQQNNFDTLTEALQDLQKRGYTKDLKLEHDRVVHQNSEGESAFHPEDFEIVEAYRFEGMSSTDDNCVVYGIEGKDGLKGVLVTAYGAYADSISENMVKKFRMKY
ncbi:hypothetical protein FUAX_47750 (plasmid) [Fulvitalea axinellae]|uniref:Phosphoribosylpyrophosphate synthetase n=1 Tax=Fulvitalea axinellae TaxID=1182444 RepID=A0AAU9CQ38_9BACT|nr:hypothetical protein FUAX_47750 [Fulvitalea axinellae]